MSTKPPATLSVSLLSTRLLLLLAPAVRTRCTTSASRSRAAPRPAVTPVANGASLPSVCLPALMCASSCTAQRAVKLQYGWPLLSHRHQRHLLCWQRASSAANCAASFCCACALRTSRRWACLLSTSSRPLRSRATGSGA
eukprot:scaffold58131_cov36-Phaeocystis_antarctica.AAC.2